MKYSDHRKNIRLYVITFYACLCLQLTDPDKNNEDGITITNKTHGRSGKSSVEGRPLQSANLEVEPVSTVCQHNLHQDESTAVVEGHLKFLKFEDVGGLYRPCFQQYAVFTSLNLHRSLSAGVFDKPISTIENENAFCHVKPKKAESRGKPKKAGFCECCNLLCNDVVQHVASFQHVTYALTETNYAGVDALISDLTIDNLCTKVSSVTSITEGLTEIPQHITCNQNNPTQQTHLHVTEVQQFKRRLVDYSSSEPSMPVSQTLFNGF